MRSIISKDGSPLTANDAKPYLGNIQGDIEFDAHFALQTWFNSGGKAVALIQPLHMADLCVLMRDLPESIAVLPSGSGSNVIFRKEGFAGLVVSLGARFNGFEVLPNNAIRVGAGAFTKDIVLKALENGFDLTFLGAIPGTIGGALASNACFAENGILDSFLRATIVRRDGRVETIKRGHVDTVTRLCKKLKTGVIVQAVLKPERRRVALLEEKLSRMKALHQKTYSTERFRTGHAFYVIQKEFDNARSQLELPKAKAIIAELGDLQDADSSLRLDSRYPNILIGKKKLDVSEIERFGERLRGLARKQLDVELGWNIEIYGMANDARLLQRSGQN